MGEQFRSTPRRCVFIKSGGGRCRANSVHASRYCIFHDPALAPVRDAARKAGGRARSRRAAVLPVDTPDRPLASATDICNFLARLVNEVCRGQIDPRRSNAAGYLLGIHLKATERSELEDRVAKIEKILKSLNVTSDSESFEFVPEHDSDIDEEGVEPEADDADADEQD
jgi:hypothetical protein